MRNVKVRMLEIYKPESSLDWMNYKLIKGKVTFHHITKRENGGGKEVSNGALLMPIAHQYLHVIEYKELGTYLALNEMFRMVNNQKCEPTKEQRQIIEYLLKEFEKNHAEDHNAQNKLLIKEEYKKRWT